MTTGALVLVALSVIGGEAIAVPQQAETWLALAYMVVIGSGVVFVLYVVVVRLWSASRAAYGFVITPVVTVLLSGWLDDEPITAGLVVGGVLVLVGVYVGALRQAPATAQAPALSEPEPS
jgi:drug/metabolite transporter (DMT)-like permease